MKRYQKLIQEAVTNKSYAQLGIAMEAPSNSIHEWATMSYKVPQYKSLEKIAKYFKVPVPTLLMEVSEVRSLDDEIVEALFHLTDEQKDYIVTFIKDLKKLCP